MHRFLLKFENISIHGLSNFIDREKCSSTEHFPFYVKIPDLVTATICTSVSSDNTITFNVQGLWWVTQEKVGMVYFLI